MLRLFNFLSGHIDEGLLLVIFMLLCSILTGIGLAIFISLIFIIVTYPEVIPVIIIISAIVILFRTKPDKC